MYVRILIISNLCLLVAFIVVLGRSLDSDTSPESPREKPTKQKPPARATDPPPHETEALSALPTPQRFSRTNRLNALDQHIAKVQLSDYNALIRMHTRLVDRERSGYDTRLERRIIHYRLGQLDGPRAIRWYFTLDADRSEFAHGLILEGWAHTQPNDALAWWLELPEGNKRSSLLEPLVHGFLTAEGASWETLVPLLSLEELSRLALPLLESAIAKSNPSELIQMFDSEFADIAVAKRNRLAVMINDQLCNGADFESLLAWHSSIADSSRWVLGQDHRNRIVRRLGATGGDRALKWAVDNDDSQLNRVALGWVKSDQHAAGKWLKEHRMRPGSDEVAFQLAIASVVANPAKAREWAAFITDEHLAEVIDEIIVGYEK